MNQDESLEKTVVDLQKTLASNMFMVDAIFELLAEKGILTGDEVMERIKKLKEEAPPHFRWLQ